MNAKLVGLGVIEITHCTAGMFYEVAEEIMSNEHPTAEELVSHLIKMPTEKHDCYIPEELRVLSLARKCFNVGGAIEWLKRVRNEAES